MRLKHPQALHLMKDRVVCAAQLHFKPLSVDHWKPQFLGMFTANEMNGYAVALSTPQQNKYSILRML